MGTTACSALAARKRPICHRLSVVSSGGPSRASSAVVRRIVMPSVQRHCGQTQLSVRGRRHGRARGPSAALLGPMPTMDGWRRRAGFVPPTVAPHRESRERLPAQRGGLLRPAPLTSTSLPASPPISAVRSWRVLCISRYSFATFSMNPATCSGVRPMSIPSSMACSMRTPLHACRHRRRGWSLDEMPCVCGCVRGCVEGPRPNAAESQGKDRYKQPPTCRCHAQRGTHAP